MEKGGIPMAKTYTLRSAGVQCLTPGLHDKWIIDRNNKNLAGLAEVGVSEVAGDMLLRASGAFASSSVSLHCPNRLIRAQDLTY